MAIASEKLRGTPTSPQALIWRDILVKSLALVDPNLTVAAALTRPHSLMALGQMRRSQSAFRTDSRGLFGQSASASRTLVYVMFIYPLVK